jgi:hypothetical protein
VTVREKKLSVRQVFLFNGYNFREQSCSSWRLSHFGKKEHLDGNYYKINTPNGWILE